MWKNIPWQRRAEIAQKIEHMPSGMHKLILQLAFIDGLSTTEIAEIAQTDSRLISRNHKPVSCRRIQQIIADEIPDYNAYRKRGQNKMHADHHTYARNHKKVRCGKCGSTQKLEWHHMIPAFQGGTADERNMICLCSDCHRAVTDYQREKFPDSFKQKSAQKANF